MMKGDDDTGDQEPVKLAFTALDLSVCRLCALALVITAQVGCHRDGGDRAAPQTVTAAALALPYGLLELLQPEGGAVSAGWLRRLVGARAGEAGGGEPFKLQARTAYQLTPSGGAIAQRNGTPSFEQSPVSLVDDVTIEHGGGALRIVHDNDHGYGTEAVFIDSWLYFRLKPGPFVRRRPEPDEAARLLAAASDSDALLELLAPHTAATPDGDAGDKTTLTLAARPERARRPERFEPPRTGVRGRHDGEASRRWREATAVSALSGNATVDRVRRALADLTLRATFTAPRPTEDGAATAQVQIGVDHRLKLELGAAPRISAPTEWIDPPVRPRPTLDQRELLDGLVRDPQRPAGAAPAPQGE